VRRDQGSGAPAATCRVRAHSQRLNRRGRTIMSRFVAPLTFTIAAAWVVVLFVLVQQNP
jgi:hypothetical protein